jgi:hypothetical protein
MKTINNLIRITIGAVLFSALVVSCVPEPESIGGAGQTLVKLWPDNGFISRTLKMQSTPQTATLLEVRKYVANEKALSAATSVVLKYDADTTLLNAYNEENETEFVPLPPELYTLEPAISDGKISIDFNKEEGKSVMITIPNILNFDFSQKYALTFTLESVSGEGKMNAAAEKTIVVQVMAANKYDGKYEVTGTFTDYVTAAWTGYYPKSVYLITRGLNSVDKYDADFGLFGYIFDVDGTGNSVSQFGAWTPYFVFDDNDNESAVINSTTDPMPRARAAVLYTGEGAAANKFDAKTHNLDVSYQLSQQNISPNPRNLIIEHYEFKGPR